MGDSSFLTPFHATVVSGPQSDRDDNRCHANAPLFSILCLWVHRSVRYSSLSSVFSLSTTYIVLGHVRVAQWTAWYSRRPSGQKQHRLHWNGLRYPCTGPPNCIRQGQRMMMTRPPSSVQVNRYFRSMPVVTHRS